MLYSIYKNVRENSPLDSITLDELYQLITTTNEELVKSIRKLTHIYTATKDKSVGGKVKALKIQLPCITVGGTFGDGSRCDSNIIDYSGTVQIDIDVKDMRICAILDEVKEAISALPYISLCAVSPSGYGIKALVMSDNTDYTKHADLSNQINCKIIELLEPVLSQVDLSADAAVDRCGKALSQPMYLTFDKDAYFNPHYTKYEFTPDDNWVADVDVVKDKVDAPKLKKNQKVITVDMPSISNLPKAEQKQRLASYLVWLSNDIKRKRETDKSIPEFKKKSYYSRSIIGYGIKMGVGNDVMREFMTEDGWDEEDIDRIGYMYNHYADNFGKGATKEVVVNTIPEAIGGVKLIPAGKYLSDVLDCSTLTKSTHIIAPTGSGKTHINVQGNQIWVFPTTSLCQQFAVDKDAKTVWGNAPTPDGNSSLIITTYDSFPRAVKSINLADYTVVLDEVHNFTTAASRGYKLDALRGTLELIPQAKMVLTLTATPFANGIPEFEDFDTIVYKRVDGFERNVMVIKSEESRRNDIVKLIDERGHFALIFLQTTDRTVLQQWEESITKIGKKMIVINSQNKHSEDFVELVDRKTVDANAIYVSTSVIAEGVSIETVLPTVDVYIVGATHPYLIEQVSRRFRKIEQLNVFILTNSGDKPVLEEPNLAVESAELKGKLTTLAQSLINTYESVGMRLEDVNIVNAPIYCDEGGKWMVDVLFIENQCFVNECRACTGDINITIKMLVEQYGYTYKDEIVMNESANIIHVAKLDGDKAVIAKNIAIGKVFGDKFEIDIDDELFKDTVKRYGRIVNKIVKGLPGITSLGKQMLGEVFDAFDVWSDKQSARFLTYVKTLNSGSPIRKEYRNLLIKHIAGTPITSEQLLSYARILYTHEQMSATERQQMEFVQGIMLSYDNKKTGTTKTITSVKQVPKVDEETGLIITETVEDKVIEKVHVNVFTPDENKIKYEAMLSKLNVFDYSDAEIKQFAKWSGEDEADDQFWKEVKEINGFTW